jgi:peptide chain release factor 1
MLDKLKEIEQRYNELSDLLADPKIVQDHSRYSEIAREHATLEELIGPYRELERVMGDIEANEVMLEDPDPEMKAMVRDELLRLRDRKQELENTLKLLLIPRDPTTQRM